MPAVDISFALSLLGPPAGGPLAYIGPGADLSLISYFLALVAFAGTAFSAIFLWPLYALIRKIRGKDKAPPPPAEEVPGEAHAENRAES